MLEKYPKEVKVVFKNFPLSFHDYARQAATAALAAAGQGKFWEFNDLLFKSPPLNDQKIQEIARGLKLDMTAFNAKLKDPAIQKLIDRDLAEGRELGVQGTPTVFVNGTELEELSLQGLTRMIDAELGRQ